MIILDTSILRSFALDSVSTDLLRTIRTSGVDRVGVPWVVLEELTAQRAVPYREHYEKARAALQNLHKAAPWPQGSLVPLDLESFQEHWRDRYRTIVEVLPTSEEALREGLQREMNVLPPCRFFDGKENGNPVKIGARDAAIWLTAVEYARTHPDESVYFVSKNTRDFGDGTSFPFPMDEDLKGIKDRFHLLTSLSEVVQQFAESTDVDNEAVASTLMQSGGPSAVAVAARNRIGNRRYSNAFEVTAVPLDRHGAAMAAPAPDTAYGWVSGPTVQLVSFSDTKAHQIGEHVWCTTSVRWRLGGLVFLGEDVPMGRAGCNWETRVLISTSQSEAPLTILHTKSPVALTAEDWERLPHPPPPDGPLDGPFTFGWEQRDRERAAFWHTRVRVEDFLKQASSHWTQDPRSVSDEPE
ncbi:PIN domain-containing protein [Streptomyces sp. NPDC049744]|uniref:PIN domain-containing protein n=1 Tax=Streptomyces sp. NPDC049744 TaxID=3154359 RepID=UPI003431B27C